MSRGSERDTMRYVEPGEKISNFSSDRVRLKNAGDKIQLRLLHKPIVEGNHFFLKDGQWDVQACPRINDGAHCEHCEKLFAAIKSVPRIEDKEEYKKALDRAKKSVPGCDPGITYNYPAINRDTGEFVTFQATPGVRNKIDAEAEMGIKIFDVDFIVMNTGKPNKEKYALTRVDKADTAPLTEKESEIKNSF